MLAWPTCRVYAAAQPTFLERRRKEDRSSSFRALVLPLTTSLDQNHPSSEITEKGEIRGTIDLNSQEYPNLTELIPMAVTQGLSHYEYIL